jgi:integrase/recombinase XerD
MLFSFRHRGEENVMERLASAGRAPELEQHADGFAAWLGRLGYSPRTCEAQVALLRHMARWLAEKHVPVSGLTSEVAGEYAAARRGRSQLRSARALEPLLGYLRELGAVPPAAAFVPQDPVDVLLARFREWLSAERGLAPATVSSYLHQARPFATACAGQLPALTPARVAGLAVAGAAGLRPRSAQVRASAVRALLRFSWLEGLTGVPLAGAVGSFAAPAGADPPKGLSPGQAGEFLAFVRTSPGGIRNEPMIALLLRLALRASETAALLLDDIAWRQGTVTVRGKGNRADQVPLPFDVGGPLARYLRDGRPAGTGHRQVFLALDAPHGPLAGAAVTSVAGRAMRDAGISGEGAAHLLRHTAACGVLAAGGGLAEAGQLLRHAGPQVTAVYARSDITALRSIARPWPEGGPR